MPFTKKQLEDVRKAAELYEQGICNLPTEIVDKPILKPYKLCKHRFGNDLICKGCKVSMKEIGSKQCSERVSNQLNGYVMYKGKLLSSKEFLKIGVINASKTET